MNKKEKEQKLKELSNKYFWEQKTMEICSLILIVIGIIVAFYISSSIILMLTPEGVCDSDGCITSIFLTGFIGLFLFAIIGGFGFFICYLISLLIKDWIENNKEKAEERAKKELGIKIDTDTFWD